MFNNKFNSSKSDPLVEAVKQAQHDGDLRRQAEAYVNEEFGVYSRQAVVREHLAAYDAALEEAYKSLREGKPLTPAQDRELDVHDDDKIDAKDFKILRARKTGKRMEEEMDGLPPSEAAQKASPEQERQTPKKTPERTGNAAGSTISNARAATGLKEAKIKVKGNDPLEARAEYAKKGGPGQVYKKTHSKDKVGMSQADAYAIRNTGPKRGSHLPESIAEAIARKRDIAKGGVTAPIEYADKMGFANPGAISKLDEAWNKLKEARKCMEEESDTFDFSHLDEAYANYIAEAINEYGLQEEHPVVTVENLHMFNESYIAAVLDEAAEREYEKAKEHEEKTKELDEARMRAEKECNEEELEEAKKWIQSAIKRPGSLSKKLGVPEEEDIPASKLEVKKGDTAQTKKQKVLAKTLKHLARKKKMEEELQIDEVSAFGQAFRAAGGKNFSFGGKTYSGARADGKTSTPAASTPGTQGVATGKSFSAIDKAQAAKAKAGPADNPGLRGAPAASSMSTPGTVARDTGATGKPGGETGVSSGSTVSLDRAGNVGASPSAAPAPAPKPNAPAPTSTGPTPKDAKPTASSGLVGPDAGKMATPTPTTSQPGAPKDDASAGVKKLMSMNESVQVGNKSYRIV